MLIRSLFENKNYITYELCITLASIILYWFIEKYNKEGWILLDSLRRESKISMRILDEGPEPCFIVDQLGRILYSNNIGMKLCNSVKKLNLSENHFSFMKLIHEDDKQSIESILKRLKKAECDSIEILMVDNNLANFNEISQQQRTIINPEETYNDKCTIIVIIAYGVYTLYIKRVAWKSMNCFRIHCKYIQPFKNTIENALKNQLEVKDKLEGLSSIF